MKYYYSTKKRNFRIKDEILQELDKDVDYEVY